MPFDLQEAITYSEFVQAAEAIDSGMAPNYVPPAGFSLLSPLFANDLATDITSATDYVPFGFVAREDTTVVVAIRGTDNILEWVQDARFDSIKNPIDGKGRTEDGFSRVYMSLRTDHDDSAQTLFEFLSGIVKPSDSLVLCGHSLGGAIATLAAYQAGLELKFNNPKLYTFASPKVGDGEFAAAFKSSVPDAWRVIVTFDAIPYAPPGDYDDVGTTESFNPMGKVELDFLCFHHLRTYRHLMMLAAGSPNPLPLDPECTL